MKLTVFEVAKYLDVSPNTIERWVRQGRIPIQKKGTFCYFKTAVLLSWAKKHRLKFSLTNKEPDVITSADGLILEESLSCALTNGGVFHDIEGNDVFSVLRTAAEIVPGLSSLNREQLYKNLIEREELSSTGVGKGIAIPHPRTPIVQENGICNMITTCFLRNPIDFNAIDDKPVYVLFILLSKDVKTHLSLLSKIAYCTRDHEFNLFLETRPTAENLIAEIIAFESRMKLGD